MNHSDVVSPLQVTFLSTLCTSLPPSLPPSLPDAKGGGLRPEASRRERKGGAAEARAGHVPFHQHPPETASQFRTPETASQFRFHRRIAVASLPRAHLIPHVPPDPVPPTRGLRVPTNVASARIVTQGRRSRVSVRAACMWRSLCVCVCVCACVCVCVCVYVCVCDSACATLL